MGVYGVHPTRYGEMSDENLYSMFRESTYSILTESEKLDLLQETVNRDALERGEIGSPEVRFADLPSTESGRAADGVININRTMAVDGIQSSEYNGQTIQYFMGDYNCQALDTVLHENVHCFQDQVRDGTITIDDALKTAEYQANDFTVSVMLQDGRYQLGSQYLTGETANGYYCYYFQSTERDAFWSAEEKTSAILNIISEKYGSEASFEAYARSIAVTGYNAMEQEAIERFQNPNFVQDLNQTLQNQYFDTNVPINPDTEKAVKAEMLATYQSLQQQITQTDDLIEKEDTKMSFDPKPVSLEEYDQTLRGAVNDNYIRELNDPSMSREDAMRSSSEMSEKYFDAVQEFQEEQARAQEMSDGVNMSASESFQAVTGAASDVENASAVDTGTVNFGISEDRVSADGVDSWGGDSFDSIDGGARDDGLNNDGEANINGVNSDEDVSTEGVNNDEGVSADGVDNDDGLDNGGDSVDDGIDF